MLRYYHMIDTMICITEKYIYWCILRLLLSKKRKHDRIRMKFRGSAKEEKGK